MKSLENFCKLALVLMLVSILWACKGAPRYGEESGANENSNETSSTTLNPLDLPQDTRIIPELQPKKGEIKGTAATIDASDTTSRNNSQIIPAMKPKVDTLANQALRIQLFSTELFGEAKKERQIAEEIFDQPVYLDYEVPYYKVRVGSFAERKNAEFYLQKAKSAGYQNAWIVAVRVNVKGAEPLYDNLPAPKMESGQEN